MTRKPYLVWVSTASLPPDIPALFSRDRDFDVIMHTYGANPSKLDANVMYEWASAKGHDCLTIHQPGEKLNVAAAHVGRIASQYKAVAFLDDDLSFTTAALNEAFRMGDVAGLDIWQPALSSGSYGSHNHLFQQLIDAALIRRVPFVEIMMPFFSRRVLPDVLPTFDINESGWGIDIYMWPKIAHGYVLDGISFGHYRRPARRDRVLRNGLTCQQELWIQQVCHNPATAPHFPPSPS